MTEEARDIYISRMKELKEEEEIAFKEYARQMALQSRNMGDMERMHIARQKLIHIQDTITKVREEA